MKDASQYPVTFAYGAQDGEFYGPNGSVGPYHRGDDRAMPAGTPVPVNGHQIGKSGSGGSGPHLHIGRWVNGQDTNPRGQGFSLDGAVVTRVKYNDGLNGNWVGIRSSDGAEWQYLHLSEINVKVGQEISNMSVIDFGTSLRAAEGMWGWDDRTEERDNILKKYIVGRETNEALNFMYDHEWGGLWRNLRNNREQFFNDWHDKILRGEVKPTNPDYQKALAELDAAQAKLETSEALFKKGVPQ